MENFDAILKKALIGDSANIEKILDAIGKETFTQTETVKLLKATDGNISDNSYALYLRGLVFVSQLVTGVSKDESFAKAINFFDKAILLDNSYAMKSRGYMHQHGLGGPVNYAAAARLYRKAFKQATKDNKIRISVSAFVNLERLEIETVTDHRHYLAVNYHFAMLDWKQAKTVREIMSSHHWRPAKTVPEIMSSHPIKFLKLIANDTELSSEERLELTQTWVAKNASLIAEIQKQAKPQVKNLLGEYWADQAHQYLRANQYRAAIWALQNVPTNSKSYGAACYDIAMILHGETYKKQLDDTSALECARPYIERGVELKDEASIQFYNCVYSVTLLSDRIKAAMQILPLVIEQVLAARKAEQEFISKNSGIVTKLFSSLTSFFASEEKQNLAIQKQAIEFMKGGLTQFQQASTTDLLQVAKDFLNQVKTLSDKLTPTPTNTSQSLVDLSNQLEVIIVELQQQPSLDSQCSQSTFIKGSPG